MQKRERPDILIHAQLSPRNIIGCPIKKNEEVQTFWFLHCCPWEKLSALQSKQRKFPDILMPAQSSLKNYQIFNRKKQNFLIPWCLLNRPWKQLSALQSKKWKRPDILIPVQLSPRKIISSSIETTAVSWNFDARTIVPVNNYQFFNRKNENVLIFWFLYSCPREKLSALQSKQQQFPEILMPAQ